MVYPEITPLDEHLWCFHMKSFCAWNTFSLFSAALLEKQEHIKKDRLCHLLLILEMAHQWWEEIAFILSQVFFLWSISSFFSFSWEKLNVLQGWKPFNSAFNLMWLHTWYHWLWFLFCRICRQEGSHCKFLTMPVQ